MRRWSPGGRWGVPPALVLIPALITTGCTGTPERSRAPDILLVSVDSLRPDRLGIHGHDGGTSPTLDALGEAGAVFEVATSSSSWTLPAHAALMTGMPDSAHGAVDGSRPLSAERRTLAESLRAAGYQTFGVWSGPLLAPRFGFDQGFDRYEAAVPAYGEDFYQAMELSHRIVTGPDSLSTVERLLEARDPQRPLFLFVHLWDVHYDYLAPEELRSRFVDRANPSSLDGSGMAARVGPADGGWKDGDRDRLAQLYDAEVAWVDQQIGELLDLFDGRGRESDAREPGPVLVVTSDHGEEFLEHGRYGHKQQLYDESIRIPLLVRYEGVVPGGQRVEQPAEITDIAPTLLEWAGAEPLPEARGRSLASLLVEGRELSTRPAISELESADNPDTWLVAARTSRWKIIANPPRGGVLGIWDLQDDPGERESLVYSNDPLRLEAVSGLRGVVEELSAWRDDAGDGQVDPRLRDALAAMGYLTDGADGAPSANAELRFLDAPLESCDDDGLVEAGVRWRGPTAEEGLEIRVGWPTGRLFAQVGAEGEIRTGRWVRNGLRLVLVDRGSGRALAEATARVIRPDDCP